MSKSDNEDSRSIITDIDINDNYYNKNYIDAEYYNYLYKLNSLLTNYNFISKIGSKYSIDSISQSLVYYKKENITEMYTIIINDKYNIEVTIPLKNCNYTYTTNINSIKNVYNYIYFHLNN
jgi:hypothetical protein